MSEPLTETLNELHEQLQDLRDVDDQEREQLIAAVAEIQASLDRFDTSSATLAKRFRDTTERFSDDHPGLTRTAGQFADMLSSLGI